MSILLLSFVFSSGESGMDRNNAKSTNQEEDYPDEPFKTDQIIKLIKSIMFSTHLF